MPTGQMTREAVSYTWRQLLRRAGANPDTFPLNLIYGDEIADGPPAVVVDACEDRAWHCLLQQTPNTLSWKPPRDVLPRCNEVSLREPVSVLFWGRNVDSETKPFVELGSDGALIFHADIIASTLFMLTRWEETVVPVRDGHDRFPATASVAYKQGFLDRPIVDEYALILREWLKVLLPGWEPEPRTFSVKVSHDIDHLRCFPDIRTAIRTVGGDLLKRQDLGRALQNGREAITPYLTPHQTQYVKGVDLLADWSRACGLGNDAFYFIAALPDRLEGDYDVLSKSTRCVIKRLRGQGFEIGLHAGYQTLGNPERLAEEKARLDAVLNETHYGGRQHYLRFRVPDTWRHWAEAGLLYDSTMGYADHEGFRCGTCHPFRPFDVEHNAELDVWEHPLIVMDRTLADYRRLTPDQAETRICELARRCKQVEGTFTLLWHNSSLTGEWEPWGKIYRRVLGALAELQMSNASPECAAPEAVPAHRSR